MRTRVGYAGGNTDEPTYDNLDGHSETVQMDYDPSRTSYEDLLRVFWDSHDPTQRAWARQYASIIFFHDEQQRVLASQSKEREEALRKKKVHTEIKPYTRFFLAEDYHQKYWLQGNEEFRDEFQTFYHDFGRIVSSTAAVRVNGYLGHNGICELLREEWSSYGLSPKANQKLMELVCFQEISP